MITTWYLQSQRTWDKLCHSCIGSSFLPRGAFPEGRAYAFPQRLHAGSLEALRVSRPEAVVLSTNNQPRPEDVVLQRFTLALRTNRHAGTIRGRRGASRAAIPGPLHHRAWPSSSPWLDGDRA